MKKHYSLFAFLGLSLLIVYLNFSHFPTNCISYDVLGYYLYLPTTFIHHDIVLSDISPIQELVATYDSTPVLYQLISLENGNHINIYQVGMAILYLPFFLVAHFIALNTDFVADGFSAPYQYSIVIGSILYTLIGLWYFRKLFVALFSERIAAFLLLIVVLGTNYLFHVGLHGAGIMTHNYLFSLYAILLYYNYRWHLDQKWSYLFVLAIVSALMLLARPSEIGVFAILLLWNVTNWDSLKSKLRFLLFNKNQVLVYGIILFSILSLQLVYNYVCTGNFFFSGYNSPGGERIEPLNPHFFNVLFSFRKGWLLYTPVMIFALMGFYHLYKYYTRWFWVSFIFFVGNLYIVSSWSNWWYAESFSQRALIQSYVVMCIPLGAFLSRLNFMSLFKRVSVLVLIVSFSGLNLFQSWQYSKGIIHGSRMTQKYYFKVFGTTAFNPEAQKYLLIDRLKMDAEKNIDLNSYVFSKVFEWDFTDAASDTLYVDGFRMSEGVEFSKDIVVNYKEMSVNDHVWLKVTAMIYPLDSIPAENSFIAMHFKQRKEAIKYQAYDIGLDSLKLNQWNEVEAVYLSPELTSSKAVFKSYIWNRGGKDFYVRGFKVEVFEKIPLA